MLFNIAAVNYGILRNRPRQMARFESSCFKKYYCFFLNLSQILFRKLAILMLMTSKRASESLS